MNRIKKIVITGPESCGKTTLCETLARAFNCDCVKEYAREYLVEKGSKYQREDLLRIAEGQSERINEALSKAGQILICDTDLLTIKIWSEYKYGKVDAWIINQLQKEKPDLYLLCCPDIAWEKDELREHPVQRGEIFEIYKKELKELAVSYVEVFGEKEEREQKALRAIKNLRDRK